MGVRLRAASVRGPGHYTDGLPNQDAVLIRHDRQRWLAVVSDGMGSRKQAAEGAKAVCYAANRAVREQSFGSEDRDLIKSIYGHWLTRLAELRIQPNDAAATCLLAWGVPDGHFRLLQLGDGLILGEPEPAQGLCMRDQAGFSNDTTGLGISHRLTDWRSARGQLENHGDGLALMTDGISDDLGSLDGFVRSLVDDLRGVGARSAKAALTRELRDWPTPCHTDDKTIAVIYRH